MEKFITVKLQAPEWSRAQDAYAYRYTNKIELQKRKAIVWFLLTAFRFPSPLSSSRTPHFRKISAQWGSGNLVTPSIKTIELILLEDTNQLEKQESTFTHIHWREKCCQISFSSNSTRFLSYFHKLSFYLGCLQNWTVKYH